MKAHKPFNEPVLYSLAFLLALTLRLYQLGAGPLSDGEAGWALQALGIVHGSKTILGAQPAYIILTSQLLSLFGDTNFIARFIPALSGALLVWLPLFFRRWMGASGWLHTVGVVLAFGLAVDPGLVSLSRQVGGPMPAVAFTLLALASLYGRHWVGVGIFAGLALLSGPAFLQGLLILAISWLLYRTITPLISKPQPKEGFEEPGTDPISAKSITPALVAFGATLLVAGTLFLQHLQGLGALADTVTAYLKLWVSPSGIPVLRLPASLLVYQPLVLIFGVVAMLRAAFGKWIDLQVRQVMLGLCVWTLVAIFLPMLYAGHQVGDIAWALLPLWALAATEISRSLTTLQDATSRIIAAGLVLLLFVLAVVGWINLLSIGRYQENVLLYWAVIGGALLLGLIAVLLVAASWSASTARLGVVWSLCLVLGLQLFSNTWGMTIVRQNSAQDLWSPPTTTGQEAQFQQTLSDLSTWNTGLKDQVEVVTLVDSPALKWALRHFPKARFESSLSSTEAPPIVITSKDTELPSLAQKYRGQDFIWWLAPGWPGVFPSNFINWLAFRQAALGQGQIILWARADIFPGGSLNPSENVSP